MLFGLISLHISSESFAIEINTHSLIFPWMNLIEPIIETVPVRKSVILYKHVMQNKLSLVGTI